MLLELSHERDQRGLLRRVELELEHQVEELDRVFQGQQAAVMEIRRRFLYAAQGERLDRALCGRHQAVDRLRLVEAIDLQVVHQVVGVERRRVAGGALRLAEEQRLATHFRGIRRELSGVKLSVNAQAGRGREVE